MTEQSDETVRKRAIFYVGGYDPKSDTAFFDRMDKESRRYEKLHDVVLKRDPLTSLNEHLSHARFTRDGSETVVTDFYFIRLDDIIARDFARPFLIRLFDYLKAFANYMITGTGFAFLRHAWRFIFYFLYPITMLLLFTAVSLGLAWLIALSGVALSWLMAPVIFLASFSACIQLIGKNYFVLHLFDLWTFTLGFAQRSRQDIEIKLQEAAREAQNVFSQGDYDETLLIGHSTGCSLILDVAGRYIEANPDAKLTVLTVGSTALKVGLHPAAKKLRERVSKFLNRPQSIWVEYQSRTDIMNFFRADPARLMGVDVPGKPILREIRMKQMVEPEIYRRFSRNRFRGHYQFVFANTRPHHYDFLDICFGPTPLITRAKAGGSFLAPALRKA